MAKLKKQKKKKKYIDEREIQLSVCSTLYWPPEVGQVHTYMINIKAFEKLSDFAKLLYTISKIRALGLLPLTMTSDEES